MNSAPSDSISAPRKHRPIGLSRTLWFWCLCVPLTAAAVDAVNRNFVPPLWGRVLLCLVPLAPGILFVRGYKRAVAKADELKLLIEREAFAFTFFGLIGVFISVDLLENADVLPGFVWTTKTLTLAMLVLHALGVFWTTRRYR